MVQVSPFNRRSPNCRQNMRHLTHIPRYTLFSNISPIFFCSSRGIVRISFTHSRSDGWEYSQKRVRCTVLQPAKFLAQTLISMGCRGESEKRGDTPSNKKLLWGEQGTTKKNNGLVYYTSTHRDSRFDDCGSFT